MACLEIRLAEADEAVRRAAIAALRPAAQDAGVAVVLRDLAELARDTGCDGVVIDAEGPFDDARRTTGPNGIVGVHAGLSRHAAMLAGERGADFVGLDPDPDLVAWWAELMEVPCVAFAAGTGAQAAALAAAGADFVAAGEAVWRHPEGPIAGVRGLQAAIAAAGAAPSA